MDPVIRVSPFHKDGRGELSYLSVPRLKVNDVLLIFSKKGSIRANHFHKKDVHTMYLVKGRYKYTYRDLRMRNPKTKARIIKAGMTVVSPARVAHKVEFLEDSLMVVLTTESRQQEKYEKDTVRLDL